MSIADHVDIAELKLQVADLQKRVAELEALAQPETKRKTLSLPKNGEAH